MALTLATSRPFVLSPLDVELCHAATELLRRAIQDFDTVGADYCDWCETVADRTTGVFHHRPTCPLDRLSRAIVQKERGRA